MTTQSDFTPEEWAAIRKTLHEPGVAVILASPGGALREFFAVARGVMEASETFKESGFIQAVLRSDGSGPEPKPRTEAAGDFMDGMIANLRRAMKIVETKATPAEAEDYRRLVLMLAERVAGAAKEGESAISDDEQRVLDEIRLALRRKV